MTQMLSRKGVIEKVSAISEKGQAIVQENTIWQLQGMVDEGLITLHKLYCGPLRLHSGEYQVKVTDKGREFANG